MEFEERVRRERAELQIPPWGFAPSEADDGPSPYPPTSAGAIAWAQAQEWRRQIRERDPHYFGRGSSGDED